MATKSKNETTRTSGRGSRKASEKVSANELQTVVSSVSVSAPENGLNSNTTTNNIGVSSVVDPRSLSVSSGMGVSSERVNKSSGHNNAASQIDALIQIEETEEKAKEDRLYNKVVSHFVAPVFDADKRKAELLSGHVLAGGSISPAIIAKVDEIVSAEKKTFTENNPAPVCNVSRVIDVIKENYKSEFANVVGCSIDDVKPEDVKTHSRALGVLTSVSIPANATAQLIVRSVLSYKYLILDRAAKAKERSNNNANYYDGLRLAVRSGVELHRTDDQILEDVKYYLSMIRESDSRELSKLRANFLKIRERLDNISRDIYNMCPAIVDVVNNSYLVRLDRVKKFHIPAKVKTDYISKYRCAVADLTRINQALFGVTSL